MMGEQNKKKLIRYPNMQADSSKRVNSKKNKNSNMSRTIVNLNDMETMKCKH